MREADWKWLKLYRGTALVRRENYIKRLECLEAMPIPRRKLDREFRQGSIEHCQEMVRHLGKTIQSEAKTA